MASTARVITLKDLELLENLDPIEYLVEFEDGSIQRVGDRRLEFAIELPNGRLWHDWSAQIASPEGGAPTVYATAEHAKRAREDVIAIVEDAYGAVDYRPCIVARIVGRVHRTTRGTPKEVW